MKPAVKLQVDSLFLFLRNIDPKIEKVERATSGTGHFGIIYNIDTVMRAGRYGGML